MVKKLEKVGKSGKKWQKVAKSWNKWGKVAKVGKSGEKAFFGKMAAGGHFG